MELHARITSFQEWSLASISDSNPSPSPLVRQMRRRSEIPCPLCLSKDAEIIAENEEFYGTNISAIVFYEKIIFCPHCSKWSTGDQKMVGGQPDNGVPAQDTTIYCLQWTLYQKDVE